MFPLYSGATGIFRKSIRTGMAFFVAISLQKSYTEEKIM
jgi:hypothetical protein